MSSSRLPAPPDVLALRPFVPATDFELSVRFYAELGFDVRPLGDGLALMQLGGCAFLLQSYAVAGFAENVMLEMLVRDVSAWWERTRSLDLPARYGVREPRAPERQPWGANVAFVFDPSRVLWHLTEHAAR